MGYSIKIDHDNKYIHYSHQGKISRKEIGDAWIELLNMTEFSKEKYNLLSDYRNGIFDFNIENIGAIEEFLKANQDILKGKKNAVIVDNPNETVIAMMFENNMQIKINYAVKTFSTLNAAIKYLIESREEE